MPDEAPPPPKKVFVSYSQDSDEHKARVIELVQSLRDDGFDAKCDQFLNGQPKDIWTRWMTKEILDADHVLMVFTEPYKEAVLGHVVRGVNWEGAVILEELAKQGNASDKFIPVVFSPDDKPHIFSPLSGRTHYHLDPEYEKLKRFLRGEARIEPRPIGQASVVTDRRASAAATRRASANVDISRILDYAPEELIGREPETALLNDAWQKAVNDEFPRPHVFTFVALGGEGKTAIVADWISNLAHQGWPNCDFVFGWSFYSQGSSDQAAVSSDLFMSEALTFFGDPETANSAKSGYDKGKRLAELVGARRSLLILDGLEPLQYPPNSPAPGELKDEGIAVLLKGLASNDRGLCVVTTRYSVPNLKAFHKTTAPEIELKRLPKEAAVSLLLSLGVGGPKSEFEAVVEQVKGHALTLTLLGTFLKEAHGGDVRKRDLVKLSEANASEQHGHAFHVMDAYVHWLRTGSEDGRQSLALLSLIGLFDRPASAECISALLQPPAIEGLTEPISGLAESRLNLVLARLECAKLVTVNRDVAGRMVSVDSHPLIREYFATALEQHSFAAWQSAHRRLYEYLAKTTPDRPDGVDGLQPLYQAVRHGCLAGLQQEACDDVYLQRILRRGEFYATSKLGAFGTDLAAIAAFFQTPWSAVSTSLSSAYQAWILSQAAFCLRALGRLREATPPMTEALEKAVEFENWKSASARAGNLAELLLTMGEIEPAVQTASRSLEYADLSKDPFDRLASRSRVADALHQAGRQQEALERFKEGEEIQVERQPQYPLLYSVRGFMYCDLLLANRERSAWRAFLHVPAGASAGDPDSFRAISQRAGQSLELARRGGWLLDVALDHLTLGRNQLYEDILHQRRPEAASPAIQAAVEGLRKAGHSDELPRGLLTHAWLLAALEDFSGAQADLAEAWEIAERGPMPLHLADIHLYRCRLFHAVDPYPWEGGPKHDLAEARRLIKKHGYWRRKEELEDADEAAKNW